MRLLAKNEIWPKTCENMCKICTTYAQNMRNISKMRKICAPQIAPPSPCRRKADLHPEAGTPGGKMCWVANCCNDCQKIDLNPWAWWEGTLWTCLCSASGHLSNNEQLFRVGCQTLQQLEKLLQRSWFLVHFIKGVISTLGLASWVPAPWARVASWNNVSGSLRGQGPLRRCCVCVFLKFTPHFASTGTARGKVENHLTALRT